eukprot:SAG31_NODE_48291_length_196_cov_10.061856_1_plen_60_part_10
MDAVVPIECHMHVLFIETSEYRHFTPFRRPTHRPAQSEPPSRLCGCLQMVLVIVSCHEDA